MRGLLILAVLSLGVAACGDSSPTLPDEIWTTSGAGNDVFDRPSHVERVEITGTFTGSSSNFIVHCGTQLVVNELLGTSFGPTEYSGTHLLDAGCNPIEITNSSEVSWTFEEVR